MLVIGIDPSCTDRENGYALMDLKTIHEIGRGRNAIREAAKKASKIVVEGQYIPAQKNRQGRIITLAHEAGRWIELGWTLDIPVVYMLPSVWMALIYGKWVRPDDPARRWTQEKYFKAVYRVSFDKYSQHELDAVSIGYCELLGGGK